MSKPINPRLINWLLCVLIFTGLALNIYVAISSRKSPPQKQRIHNWPSETAWILDVNEKNRLVTIRTIEKQIVVKFEVLKEDLQDFHVGSIAPVTFKCAEGYNDDCDLTEPYKLFVSGREVIPR